jgi:hypothetical protein
MIGGSIHEVIADLGEHQVRHSRRLSDELVEDARRVFQKRTERMLSSEDARQILENLSGFFSILHEWDLSKTGDEARNCPIPVARDASA